MYFAAILSRLPGFGGCHLFFPPFLPRWHWLPATGCTSTVTSESSDAAFSAPSLLLCPNSDT